MTKKKLNIDNIANELEGASLFFTRPATPPPPAQAVVEKEPSSVSDSPISENPPVQEVQAEEIQKGKVKKAKQPSNRDTMTPRYHDTTTPRYHESMQASINDDIVGLVRKAVKEFGKEAATHRFTVAEKKELADLIYVYKNRGVKTSENEITRISVNFVVEDYKINGENSVLHKILEALNG